MGVMGGDMKYAMYIPTLYRSDIFEDGRTTCGKANRIDECCHHRT